MISGEESDRYLQRALITFPLVLLPLLQKCNKFLTNTATGSKLNVEAEPFFSAAYSPPSLSKLASLFIDKNYSLWTDQKVSSTPSIILFVLFITITTITQTTTTQTTTTIIVIANCTKQGNGVW